MPDPVLKPTSGTAPEPAEDPWHMAFEEFKARDAKVVKDYQEEIDTLLVFAGLFSAVLTAFVVESYQSLQEDLAQTSVDLLRHISHQLANSSFPAAADSSQFHAQRSDVRVNICWFVSLLLSLFVALFGIFLKQWMRAYMKWTDVTPEREAVAIRQFRYRSLETWRLQAILALLPTLLQLSVILFLSGLLVFLWHINQMLADAMAVLLSIAFVLVAAVTFLPVITWTCPYRSPLSELLTLSLWRTTGYVKIAGIAVWVVIQSAFTFSPDSSRWEALAKRWRDRAKTTLPTSWVQADENAIDRYNMRGDRVSMHVGAMVHLCCTTQLQSLWSAAISAIAAKHPLDSPGLAAGSGSKVYYTEVWRPVFRHITLLDKREWDRQPGYNGSSPLFPRISSQFTRFSSSMKQCWVNFLLHSKTSISQAEPSRVIELYLLCCIASMEPTAGGQCMVTLMEVVKARHQTLEPPWLDSIASSLSVHANTRASRSMWNPTSGPKFLRDMQEFCIELREISRDQIGKYRQLLDILVQLACQAALPIEPNPSARVPEGLRNLLTALKPVYDNSPQYPASHIARSCSSALISVARKETDLFPKPLARAIVRQIDPQCLSDAVKDVEGLDLTGVNVHSRLDSLDARSLAAIEILISPGPFTRILQAYKTSLDGEASIGNASGLVRAFVRGMVDGL